MTYNEKVVKYIVPECIMVNRNHHFPPKDAPLCTFCQDGGIYKLSHPWSNEYRVCGCPAGQRDTKQLQSDCDSMNLALRSLERKTQR